MGVPCSAPGFHDRLREACKAIPANGTCAAFSLVTGGQPTFEALRSVTRGFGDDPNPLVVPVRSRGGFSMPG